MCIRALTAHPSPLGVRMCAWWLTHRMLRARYFILYRTSLANGGGFTGRSTVHDGDSGRRMEMKKVFRQG